MKKLCLMALVAMLAFVAIFATMGAARVVNVPCGSDIASRINSDPATTATRFVLGSCTYTVSTTLKPENGDEIAGPVGTFVQRGPAYDPENIGATITGTGGLDQVMKPQGTFHGEWFNVTGGAFTGAAGSGTGIAGGAMSPDSSLYAVRLTGNEGVGMSNANGVLERVEVDRNGTSTAAQGFIAAGVKGISEFIVVHSYVHDNGSNGGGNGIWLDEFAIDTNVSYTDPQTGVTTSNKAYVADNLVVRTGKQGIRWERVDAANPSGEALIVRNEVHENNLGSNTGGIGVRDAANATITNNVFGAKTIAGISYGKNGQGVAVHVSDSGRSDRPNTTLINVTNNTLAGEVVKCVSGTKLTCSPNR